MAVDMTLMWILMDNSIELTIRNHNRLDKAKIALSTLRTASAANLLKLGEKERN